MLLSDMSQASDPFSTLPSPKKMLSFVDGHKDPRSLMTTHLEDAKYWIWARLSQRVFLRHATHSYWSFYVTSEGVAED